MVGIVGASGSPEALSIILGALPETFPAPIIVVISLLPKYAERLVAWLNTQTRLPVVMAEGGLDPEPGVIFVAVDDSDTRQLLLQGGRLRFVDRDPCVFNVMDNFFRSMADELGSSAVGVLLGGMGPDGVQGAKAIRDAGGHTITLDESTIFFFGKPSLAVKRGVVSESLPVPMIGPRLVELATQVPQEQSPPTGAC